MLDQNLVTIPMKSPVSSGVGQGVVDFILLSEVESQNCVKTVKDPLYFCEGSWEMSRSMLKM